MMHNLNLNKFIQSLLNPDSPIKSKDGKKLQHIIKKSPNLLRTKDMHNNTPIHIYVGSCSVDMDFLDRLFKFDVEVATLPGRFGRLPLHYALCRCKGDPAMIKYLLNLNSQGASSRTNGGWIPLHYAVDRDEMNLEIVQALCECYPQGPFVKDFDGKVALHWAVDRIYPINQDVIRYLVKMNPEACLSFASDRILSHGTVISYEWNPINRAMELGHRECVRIMLNCVDSKTRDKKQFGELNWEARRIVILSVTRASANKTSLDSSYIVSSHAGGKKRKLYQDSDNAKIQQLYMKLYKNYYPDVWRVVMSFL